MKDKSKVNDTEETLKDRLANTEEEVRSIINAMTMAHGFLSYLDVEKYRKKSDLDLSNTIAMMSTALTHLNKYYRREFDEKE
jgi:hypothetical protein